MSVKKSLPSSAIKMIALITMFTDHMGYALGRTGFLFIPRILGLTTDPYIVSEWVWLVFRSVGRIAFPLFCFMLVEGFFHTGSHRRHLILLGSFALISEILRRRRRVYGLSVLPGSQKKGGRSLPGRGSRLFFSIMSSAGVSLVLEG